MNAHETTDRQEPQSVSPPSGAPMRLVVISAGTSTPSTTRTVAAAIADQVVAQAAGAGRTSETTVVELRELATDIAAAATTGVRSQTIEQLSEQINMADGVIASAPVFKAKMNGLFSLLLQVLDRDLFIAKPVVLAATAGTVRHTLVVDNDMRAQFAYLRALVMPTGVFASSHELNSQELTQRIDRAAAELWACIETGVGPRMRELSAGAYTTDFGSTATVNDAVDFDTDLMRLATGGSLFD